MARLDPVKFYAGDHFTFTVTVTDRTTGAVVPVSGASVAFALAATDGYGRFSGSAILSKSGSVTDGPNGEIEIALAKADTKTLAGNFYAEVEITDLSGNENTAAFPVTILPTLID